MALFGTATPAHSGEATKPLQPMQCVECHQTLSQQRYILHERQPYCIRCYEAKFANTCHECSQVIATDSKDVGFKDKHWHDRCFVCKECGAEIIDKPFAYRDENLFCSACYDKNPLICAGCGKPFLIGSKKYVFQSKQWHEDCFKCTECQTPIGTTPFIPYQDQPCCTACYENKFALKCVKCDKVIDKGGLKYKGTPFHTDCFTCSQCNHPLSNDQFAVKDERQYCVQCYGQLFAKKCTKCSKAITGLGPDGSKFVSFEGRQWHLACFMCHQCSVSMVGKGFLAHGNNIFCPECDKST